jgi:ParD-like antitoxin of type II bacterial toxin-antitoxin system
MSHSVKLSEELYTKASKYGDIAKRSVPKQIEYWAEIGKIAEENPDLSFDFIKQILISQAEIDSGEISKYKFG